MVATILVNQQLEEGRKLLGRLDETSIRIDVALWMNVPDTDYWRLLLGTTGVNRTGARKIYAFIRTVIDQYGINLLLSDISVEDRNSDLCKAYRQVVPTELGLTTVPFFGYFLNGHRLPDSMIYRVR